MQTYHFVAIVSFLTSSDRDEPIISDPALSQKNRVLPLVKRKRMDVSKIFFTVPCEKLCFSSLTKTSVSDLLFFCSLFVRGPPEVCVSIITGVIV